MRPLLRPFAVLALLLAGAPVQAEIYKYYDADGNLVLSDTVPKDKAQEVEKLQPRQIMTVPAMAPDRRARPQPAPDKARAPAPGEYTIVVQSPANGETYPRGGDPVPVGVSVNPGLAAGHRLEMRLDGQAAADLARIEPDKLDRGSHSLLVQVLDGAGKVLKATEVTFHVQQPSLQSPAAKAKAKAKAKP